MAFDISSYEPMLKKYYEGRNPQLIAYKRFPTLRLLSKVEDWTGSTYEMPIWWETPQGVGHDFTDAKAGKDSNSQVARWSLTRSNIYGFAKLDRLTMKASMGDKRAFLRLYTTEVDGVLQLMGRELSGKVFGTRACIRSTISAIGNGDGTNDKITLANRSDVVKFSVGMALLATSAGTAATLRNADPLYVVKIDRSAGELYMSDSRGGAAYDVTTAGDAWATSDSLHRFGDITASSDTLGIAGFAEWVPGTAPGSTSFFGVDRSLDTDRLGGIRVDGSGLNVTDSLINAGERAFEAGIELTHFVMNPTRISSLIREVDSKLERDEKTSAIIGRSAFKVNTPAGEQVVFGDPFCPPDRDYGLNIRTWKLVSTGKAPEIADEDFRMLRESDSDAYEVRIAGYLQLGCHTPGENLVITR